MNVEGERLQSVVRSEAEAYRAAEAALQAARKAAPAEPQEPPALVLEQIPILK